MMTETIHVTTDEFGTREAHPLHQTRTAREVWHERDGRFFAVDPEEMHAVRYGESVTFHAPTDQEMLETAEAIYECWRHGVHNTYGWYDPHLDGGGDYAALAECRRRGIDVSHIDASMRTIREGR